MEPQEEKLVSQNAVYFLLTLGRKEYFSNLHISIELNEEKIQKTIFADDINIAKVLKTIKNLYNLYVDSQLDETQQAIRKEMLIEVAKLLYLFG
ncbi:unknown [Sulfolobus spindle-shaped virus 6]|uniref:Uncharacterized protein n=1 Tax=Sulfolobus spindle-shaped virus 6 TaxID=693627 RepID=D1GF36_9VIRU|nr:hypothetical protein SSSV6_gp18 [Sulfolobus spindle-shaped virus 6]ACZ35738.1 unknown [Sulfolobus spindle-shaped virus 6]